MPNNDELVRLGQRSKRAAHKLPWPPVTPSDRLPKVALVVPPRRIMERDNLNIGVALLGIGS
jgi:hypothetical protein